jgi:hypothetical protein
MYLHKSHRELFKDRLLRSELVWTGRQVLLVADTLKLGGTVLSAIPDMLAAQLVARSA